MLVPPVSGGMPVRRSASLMDAERLTGITTQRVVTRKTWHDLFYQTVQFIGYAPTNTNHVLFANV
jgi:hypothetical protein